MLDDTMPERSSFDRYAPEVPEAVQALAHAADRTHQDWRRLEYIGSGTALSFALLFAAAFLVGWMTGASDDAEIGFWLFAVASAAAGYFHLQLRRVVSERSDIELQLYDMGWSYDERSGAFHWNPDRAEPGKAVPPRDLSEVPRRR